MKNYDSIVMKGPMIMIYVCPTCNKEFSSEEEITAHLLKCWKEQNPHHKSKPAPHSEDITTVEASEDVEKFFASLQEVDYE